MYFAGTAEKKTLVYALLLLNIRYTVHGNQNDICGAADGVSSWMGDGSCDPQNISSECQWDGGDCCRCTCEDEGFVCGTDGYLCLDPNSVDDSSSTCEEESLSACSAEDQEILVIENSTQAAALARSVNCSGGAFDVKWKGTVVVDTEIVVSKGTFLKITGVGSSAVLDGGGKTRLFRVVDASLQLNDVEVSNGSATFGGAIMAINSTLALHQTSFIGNTATEKNGGAVFLYRSNISFSGQTDFFNNSAKYGGALYAVSYSSAVWEGVSNFTGNYASHSGGALSVMAGSDASWAAEATFKENIATMYRGGALFLQSWSSALWNDDALFVANVALYEGGAIFVDTRSNSSWSKGASFFGNSATYAGGGAVLISDSSALFFNGNTSFTSNSAGTEGGAVASRAIDSSTFTSSGKQISTILITGTTVFSSNSCGSNGGGISLLSGLSLSFQSNNITFIGNEAGVSGGGVFLSTVGEGPDFTNITFISNSAEVGGGVYISGSGTSLDDDLSVTFDGCNFISNEALVTGGAIEVATGTVNVTDTLFMGNKAKGGGALWLAGSVSLEECSFEENISDLDGGQAISMIGYSLVMDRCSFSNNLYDCEPGTFLDDSKSGDRFEVVCLNCDICETCEVDKNGRKPTCSKAIEHTNSSGGTNTTLQTLSVDPGYWRATNDSVNILACYNEDACKGGLTDSPTYCRQGYTGPYCSMCIDGYVKGAEFTCTKCPENIWGDVTAVVILAVSLVITVAAIKYVMRVDIGVRPGITTTFLNRVPLQSVKTVIFTWQILTQFTTATPVFYPGLYQRFLNVIRVVNFDLTYVSSASCFINLDFHGRLLILTIGPIMVMLFMSGTYTYAVHKHLSSEEALIIVRHKHVSVMFLVMLLVYSSVSSVVFQMFDCEALDDGKNYLRADYNIECDSPRHRTLMIYSGVMIVLYPLGIPGLFIYRLLQNRNVLMNEARRKHTPSVRSISSLWKPYRPSRFYYEVIECIRRIMLTGMVFIIDDDSAAQITVTLILAFGFIVVSEGLAPFRSQLDAWVSRLGHAVVIASVYYALSLKLDVPGGTQANQRAFEFALIAMNFGIVAGAIVAAFVKNTRQVEDPWPRVHRHRLARHHFARPISGISPASHNSSHVTDVRHGLERPAPLQRGNRFRPVVRPAANPR